jgi:hypothetical protein
MSTVYCRLPAGAVNHATARNSSAAGRHSAAECLDADASAPADAYEPVGDELTEKGQAARTGAPSVA